MNAMVEVENGGLLVAYGQVSLHWTMGWDLERVALTYPVRLQCKDQYIMLQDNDVTTLYVSMHITRDGPMVKQMQ